MTTNQATPGEVIDVRPLGDQLADAKNESLFQTDQVKVLRMVLPTGKTIPEHEAPGEIIVQCLEGRIEFSSGGKTVELQAGQLLYLTPEVPHAVHCIENASFLLTILTGN